MTVDPTGNFAYVANGVSGNVSAYSIGADGSLTQLTTSPFAAGNSPTSVAVDPTGKFAYVANAISNNVSAYSIGADGSLTQLTTSPSVSGPMSVAVDPTGKFAYVVNNISSNVSAYSIGADGSLTQLTTSPFAAGTNPVSVAITPRVVPFASSSAGLFLELDHFELDDSFTLGANSKGINPDRENVTLQMTWQRPFPENFSVMIPAGSFKPGVGITTFEGVVNVPFGGAIHEVILAVSFDFRGKKTVTFSMDADGLWLEIEDSATVVLTIGVNSGTTTTIPIYY